ncbi:MAG: hypothetical protein V7L04_19775 [Nostoc sp.]
MYKVKLTLQLIHDDYRLRFGIESSYRMKTSAESKQKIKNPTIRLLFVALALFSENGITGYSFFGDGYARRRHRKSFRSTEISQA